MKALAAMVEPMKDGTRDKALTDLVADGKLRRVKNGLYEVPGAAAAPSLFESTEAGQ